MPKQATRNVINMSKTVYYIGAGASFGKRDENGIILEGVPVVAEIPREFSTFRRYIADAEIPAGDILFPGICVTDAENIERYKRTMLSDIDDLQRGIQEHATIDTYARKLYLTRQFSEFKKLKDVLCSFFVWSQLVNKQDGRYDTFLANILEEGTLDLPVDISIISWNYDSQIEMAYKAYRKDKELPVFEKNIMGEWPRLPKCGRIFKINGSATFVDTPILSLIKATEKTTPAALQLIRFYDDVRSDTTDWLAQMRTHLSFSWEKSENHNNMMESLSKTTLDTEQVVVIGYSFPFFNRETDREIIGSMANLKKIYVQDMNADEVEQSLMAVLPIDKNIRIEKIYKCSQFCLPKEL